MLILVDFFFFAKGHQSRNREFRRVGYYSMLIEFMAEIIIVIWLVKIIG